MRQYRFHEFSVDPAQRRLTRVGGEPVELSPRHFDALLHFVEHAGELLTKDALLTALWPGLVVEENSLSQTISALRRALGDEAQNSRCIQTVPRRGFRFVAPVTVVELAAADHAIIGRPDEAPAAGRTDTSKPPLAGTADGHGGPGVDRRLLIGAATGIVLASAGVAAWWWRQGPASAATTPTTLAILPFKPLVASPRDEMLELGMADSLIARLSNLPGVAVRSIGSVRRYGGPEQDPIGAARDLGVVWIVDGTVQRWGSQVRVTARLLNTASGEAAWSGSFDESFTGIFDLQDAISTRIAQVLTPRLERRDRTRLAGTGGTRNLDAYQLYLAGRHQAQGIRTAGLLKSLDLYRQAIALDPEYALAYVGIAESNRRMIFGADGEPARVFKEATRNAQRAVEIDPGLAEAHASIGWNRFWNDWDWPGAETAFRQAIALNPSESNAHFGYSQLLETLGRNAEAIEQLRIARELDPLSIILLTLESVSLFFVGKRDEARQRLQRVFDIEPDFWVAYMAQAGMLGAEGKATEAIASLERADRFADGSSQAAAALGFLLARTGARDRAMQVLARLDEAAKTRYVPPTAAGMIHVGLGDKAAALDALERGFALRDVRMTLVKADGRWKPVRDDPRYDALMQRMKLA